MNSDYRELLMDIADEVTMKELARMKFMCADILPDVKPNANSEELLVEVFNFFLELEKQNILSVNNLDKLKYLLEKAKRKDLVEKIEDFQRKSGITNDNTATASTGVSSSSVRDRPEVPEQHVTKMETSEVLPLMGRMSQSEDNGQHELVKSIEAPRTEHEEHKAKDKKRKKRARYKQKKKAEKQLACQYVPSSIDVHEEAEDGVVSESTVCTSKGQEDQMLIETNNNLSIASLSSSSSANSSLMSTKELKGIPSDLKPENAVSPGQAIQEEKPLPTPDREIEFINEQKPTEKQAKGTEKEQLMKDLPKQIRKGEMPRNGQAKAEREMPIKEAPNPTNEDDKKVGEEKKAEESVQEALQTPVPQEKEVHQNVLKQAKKKKRAKGVLTSANDVEKSGDLVADVSEKVLPSPKKDCSVKEVLTSSAKEAREELTSSEEQSRKEMSGAATFQPRHILSLCSRWQNWGESIPVINRELCLALARAGHRVTCLVLTSTDFDKEDARKGNVELIQVQCSDKPGIKRDDPQLLYHGQQINFLPDLVIGHGKLTGPASVFYAENASCPRLHVIHDLPAECLKLDSLVEQQCNEEQLAKNADFVAVIGSLLKEKWSSVINRDVIELIPGLPELSTRNRIPSPQCRCFIPAKFSSPLASGLRLAIKTVNNSSKRERPPRKTTLIVCNTDSSGSVKPAKKVLKEVDQSLVDLNQRLSVNSQEAHFDIVTKGSGGVIRSLRTMQGRRVETSLWYFFTASLLSSSSNSTAN